MKLVFTSPMNQIDQGQGREGVAAAHDEVVLVRRVGAEHGAPAQLQRAPHRRRARSHGRAAVGCPGHRGPQLRAVGLAVAGEGQAAQQVHPGGQLVGRQAAGPGGGVDISLGQPRKATYIKGHLYKQMSRLINLGTCYRY